MKKTIHSSENTLIRAAIKSIREEAGLTQRELCRQLGREHTFISKCELGERRVDIAEFYWICEACNTPPQMQAVRLMEQFEKLNTI